jgi:hypothetical protein
VGGEENPQNDFINLKKGTTRWPRWTDGWEQKRKKGKKQRRNNKDQSVMGTVVHGQQCNHVRSCDRPLSADCPFPSGFVAPVAWYRGTSGCMWSLNYGFPYSSLNCGFTTETDRVCALCPQVPMNSSVVTDNCGVRVEKTVHVIGWRMGLHC